MNKVDCGKYANDILTRVSQVENKGELLIITTGHDPASESYVKGKLKDSEKCGIKATKVVVDTEENLITEIIKGNLRDQVSGIIIQLPLPKDFKEEMCTNFVDICKDVDGFRYGSPFLPCTPEGIVWILKQELGDLTGKTALVIGRGKLVGDPVTKLLVKENCTVTIAHSKTQNLKQMLGDFDIIVSATGIPSLINLEDCDCEMFVDVGIGVKDGKLSGDCFNFRDDLKPDMKVVTIPNGIGLITRAALMAHVAKIDI